MHHRDYEQPLMIVWLCRSCHRREHIDIRNGRLDYPAERQSKSVEYTGVQVNLWMEAEDRELLRKAARLAGHNTSSYTRHVAIIQARKDLALSKGLTPRRPRAAHAR
jgi:hypothetical protein